MFQRFFHSTNKTSTSAPQPPSPRAKKTKASHQGASRTHTQGVEQGAVPGQLSLKHGREHLIVTGDGLWAFYVLSEHDWAYTTPAHRQRIMTDATFRWSELAGRRIWLRGIPVPPSLQGFLHLDYATTTTRLPDIRGARSWDDYLSAAVHHTCDLGARKQLTVLGVLIADAQLTPAQLATLIAGEDIPQELETLARVLKETTTIIAKPGLTGVPITAEGLRWVIHTSLAMSAPTTSTTRTDAIAGGENSGGDASVPSALTTDTGRGPVITSDGVAGFTSPVYATQDPCAPTTLIRTLHGSYYRTCHVAVLHADTFADRTPLDDATQPWLAWLTNHPTPTHYLLTGRLVPGHDLTSAAELDRRKTTNIAEHYREHHDDPPAAVLAGITRAKEIETEVTHAPQETGTRFVGVLMIATTATTREETLTQAQKLTIDAAREQGITLTHDFGQYAYCRAFTPGEPCPQTGHLTHMPGYYLATAVPTATHQAGDNSGLLIGPIAGSRRVVTLDPFGGTKLNRSNMMVILGEPGAGKSALAAAIMDHTATRNIRTIGYDPSGPWQHLTQLPHLRGNTRHISLSGGHRGMLVPHTMITDPHPTAHPTRDSWEQAMAEAAQERMELAIDTFRDLLPYGMVTSDTTGAIIGTIEDAVTQVGGAYGTNPWAIVDALRARGEVGRNLADRITATAQLKSGGLIFPDPTREVDDETGPAMLNQAALTIITMEGLALPPANTPNRALWSRDALRSVPILHLGARFATRTIYADHRPKCVMLDELGISTAGNTGSFSTFAVRTAFDSRKWHACVGLVAQNPATITALDPQIANLTGAAYIGRLETHTATAAMPLLRLPDDAGYEHHIAALDTGGFLMRDWAGRVRQIHVDWDWWHPDLRHALTTHHHPPTPTGGTSASTHWAHVSQPEDDAWPPPQPEDHTDACADPWTEVA